MEQMLKWGKHVLGSRVMKVALAGGSGLLLQTLVFELLATISGFVSHSTAVLIGAECGVLLSFAINNRYSFGEHHVSAGPLWLRFARYHIVVIGSLAIQWVCVFAVERVTTDFYAIHAAYLAGVVLGFISNYTGYRLFVWRGAATTPPRPDTAV